jgi:hypothetical protein
LRMASMPAVVLLALSSLRREGREVSLILVPRTDALIQKSLVVLINRKPSLLHCCGQR